MTTHARLGASNAHRWLHCPGSVRAEAGLPDSGSVFAQEGSAAHSLAEYCLVRGQSSLDLVGSPAPEHAAVEVSLEMAEAVQQYIDYLCEIGGEQEYEKTVSYDEWVPGGFGTADAIAYIEREKTLHVVDFKYGKGVRVNAERNEQAMLYGLGAYQEYGPFADIETVHIHIVQPRKDHIDDWRIGVLPLIEWAEWVSERADLALSDNARRVPAEAQCRFCRAAATCPALLEYTHKVVGKEFDALDADRLSDAELRAVLDAKPLITRFLSAVEDHVIGCLSSGKGFPGYKLVAGRSIRQWCDDASAEQALIGLLGDEAYERKLLSVAKAEKVLGKEKSVELVDLITKPEGKPTLAPASDKRASISINPDDFDS